MIGKTISHYRITRELGAGGMGVVYEAVDTKLDRTVALKFLPPESTRDPEAKARFIHEAKAASALDHPNVCTIHEIGETDDGQLFLAMARYKGETLKERIAKGPLPVEEAMDITRQVAEGLAKAHEREIVHRDIKPANIFLTSDGLVKILDFGLAKLSSMTKFTKTGSTMGTAAYMSPEQARGEQVDRRSDLWSLGVIFYEMLSGSTPFQAEFDQAIIYAILNHEPDELEGQDENILGLMDRLLAKDLQERYPTAEDFLVDLTGIINDSQVVIPRRKRRSSRRRYAYLAAPLLILVILLIAVRFWPSEPDPAPTAIAVAPFDNLTGQEDFDLWSRGVANLIGDELAFSPTLMVLDAHTFSNVLEGLGQDSGNALPLAGTITRAADQLQVKTLVMGSIMTSGDSIRVQVKLHDTASGQSRATQQATCASEGGFFALAQDLGGRLRSSLEIELLGKTLSGSFRPSTGASTTSPAAYRHYIQGLDWFQGGLNDSEAKDEFEKALAIDSNFYYARMVLGMVKFNAGDIEGCWAEHDLMEAVKDKLPMVQRYQIESFGAAKDKDLNASLDYSWKLQDLEPLNPFHYLFASFWYRDLDQLENAVIQAEKGLELSRQQNGFYYHHAGFYQQLGNFHSKLGNFERADEVFNMGLDMTDEKGHVFLYWPQAVNCLRRGDPEEAQVWLDRSRSVFEAWGKPVLGDRLEAWAYRDAGQFEKAREIYVRLCTEHPNWVNPREDLADMLIDQNMEIQEAQRLIDEVVEIGVRYHDTEYAPSWKTLYQQGKIQLSLGNPGKALELLKASWEKNLVYDHKTKIALQEARAAMR